MRTEPTTQPEQFILLLNTKNVASKIFHSSKVNKTMFNSYNHLLLEMCVTEFVAVKLIPPRAADSFYWCRNEMNFKCNLSVTNIEFKKPQTL